ncbi:hypothetical protein ACJRO7_034514 [Eucalyptus globulus]|uniref:Uncharacterized protein n=1 Tax=Eucalyptus globulus TaxID=34317 RepID=A0ABD3J3M7_EUCGL
MTQTTFSWPFSFFSSLLSKIQSTQARQLKLTMQKQNPSADNLQNVNKLLEKEPRTTMAEQSKNLRGETLKEATNTIASSTPLLPPSPGLSLDDFRLP